MDERLYRQAVIMSAISCAAIVVAAAYLGGCL